MIRVQVTAAEAEDVNRLIRPQSFLLVVNEKSGKGLAKQIMEETSWILLASQVKGEILATTRAGHCF
jgi:diacylglycerol kinase family enzyme